MDKLSFDTFTKKIYINAPIDKIYRCWATSSGICSWFLKSALYTDAKGTARKPEVYFATGDEYIWEWHNWDGREKGKILAADGRSFIAFSFAEVCKVSVKLEDKGKAVLVTLKQTDIPLDDESKMNIYAGCSNGWTFWLANLKAFLEYGIQLNETEFDLTKEPLAGHIYVNM